MKLADESPVGTLWTTQRSVDGRIITESRAIGVMSVKSATDW